MTNMIKSEQPKEDAAPRGSSAYLLTGALVGLVIGLILSLGFFKVRWVDITPESLTPEGEKDYVIAVALSYYAEKDIGRARSRLETLNPEMNLPNYVNGYGPDIRQEDGGPSLRMRSIYQLAVDLSDGALSIDGLELLEEDTEEPLPEQNPTPEEESAVPDVLDESQAETEVANPVNEMAEEDDGEVIAEFETPPDPTPAELAVNKQPFQLAERLNFCDQNLSQQLQVQVFDQNGVALQGVPIYIQWAGGSETFFTGLYPEIDDGYADYAMSDAVVYQLQVGGTSLFIEDIESNICQLDDGTTYLGGVWLKFQPQAES